MDRITEGVRAPSLYSGFWGPAGIANLQTKLSVSGGFPEKSTQAEMWGVGQV